MVQPRSNQKSDSELLLFDACLLGDCDEIVVQLVQRINMILQTDATLHKSKGRLTLHASSLTSSFIASHDPKGNVGREPKSYKCLSNHEKTCMKMNLYKHPEENILLFSGYNDDYDENTTKDLKSSSSTLHESVYCDVCQTLIQERIMTCTTCFDYDLCSSCFPSQSKLHFDGKHTFKAQG